MASHAKPDYQQQWNELMDEEKRKHAYSLLDQLQIVGINSPSGKEILKDLAYNYNSVSGWQHLLTDEEFEFIRNVFLSQEKKANASLDRIKISRKKRKKRMCYEDSEEVAMSENIACDAEMNLVHFEEQHRKKPLSEEEIALNEMWWPPLN